MIRRGRLAGNLLAATTVAVMFILVTSVLAAPASVSVSGPSTAEPGGEVTVSFSLTNTGESASAYILDVSVPTGWTVSDHSDDEGRWKASDPSWLWPTVNASDSVRPSVTLQVPTNASGEYTISATGKDSDGVVGSASTNVTVRMQTSSSVSSDSATPSVLPENEGTRLLTDTPRNGSGGGIPGFSSATAIAGLGILTLLRRMRRR